MTQGQPPFGEQLLGLGSEEPGLERRGPGDRVEVDQAGHSPQVEGDDAGETVAPGGQASHHRRAAAERHERDAVLGAPADHGGDLVVPVGSHDGVGSVAAVPGPHPQQVGRGLPPGTGDPPGVVDVHVGVPDQGAQLVEQVLGQGEVRQEDLRLGYGGPVRQLAEKGLDQLTQGVRDRLLARRVAPSGPVHAVRTVGGGLEVRRRPVVPAFFPFHVLECYI